MPKLHGKENGTYDTVIIERGLGDEYHISFWENRDCKFNATVPYTEMNMQSEFFNDSDLVYALHLERDYDNSVLQSIFDVISVLPIENKIQFKFKNGIFSTASILDENNEPHSILGLAAEIKFHPTGLITSQKYYDHGTLHRTDGAAVIRQYGGSKFLEYYYKGTLIPNTLIEEGVIDETNIDDEALVTMTLMGD